MRLCGSGAFVELRIAGYQFPALEPGRERLDSDSWDANWLVMLGSIQTATSTSWSFRQPVLTTWEALGLVAWLRGVAAGAVPVTTVRDTDQVSQDEHARADWLTFTEPHLKFAVSSYADPRVELLVELSHESATPFRDSERHEVCQIAMATDRRRLKHAAVALQRQMQTYPVR